MCWRSTNRACDLRPAGGWTLPRCACEPLTGLKQGGASTRPIRGRAVARRKAPRRTTIFDAFYQDLRAAWASLRRSPGFWAAAVFTLALGTGATLSIFSLVSGVLLAPLPYESPDRLMHIQGSADGRYAVSMPVHQRAIATAAGIEEVAVWQGWQAIVGRPERGIERRPGASVSYSFFNVLGARPAAGRLFLPTDGVPGHVPVVVLSQAAWSRYFGGREGAMGEDLVLDGTPYTVVGVVPEDFVDPVAAHVLGSSEPVWYWRADPPAFFDAVDNDGWTAFWSLARARPGVQPDHLRAEVARLIKEVYPSWEDDGQWLRVRSFREMATGHLTTTVAALFATAFLVLLIACVNVANLLLSRATARSRDMAIRASLGASRGRLARQLFAENLVIAAAAAMLGLLFALIATPVLVDLLQGHLRPGQAPGLDWRAATFAMILVLATAVIFGLAPAIRTSEVRLNDVLRSARDMAVSSRTRAVLIAAEVALGVVVLVCAGLLGRTLWNLRSTDPGFDADSTVVARITLPPNLVQTVDAQNAAVEALERELSAIPGVNGAGMITDLPMSGAVNSTGIPRPATPTGGPGRTDQVLVRAVTPGYFQAMGIPLSRGRAIAETDRRGTTPVAVINRSYSDLLPGGGVGQTVMVRGVPREIVGVVEDVVEFRIQDGTGDPVLYTPYTQEDQAWMRTGLHVVLRTPARPGALANDLREAVRRADPAALLAQRIRPMSDYIALDLAAYRFRAVLLVFFAFTALVLAAAGIAAVTAYAVDRQSREIGIRMALGASTRVVVRGILARSSRIMAAGLMAGLLGAFAASRTLSGFLFGVQPADPTAFVLATLTLAVVSLLAAWIPARRAATVDPVRALKAD